MPSRAEQSRAEPSQARRPFRLLHRLPSHTSKLPAADGRRRQWRRLVQQVRVFMCCLGRRWPLVAVWPALCSCQREWRASSGQRSEKCTVAAGAPATQLGDLHLNGIIAHWARVVVVVAVDRDGDGQTVGQETGRRRSKRQAQDGELPD